MNQPTREEFEAFKAEVREEVRKLAEQITEPMKPINVNLASQDVINRLDGIQQYFNQELKTVSDTWLSTLQEHYTEHKQDLSGIQTVLRGHAKFFEEHGKRLAQIESTMATKDDLAALRTEHGDLLRQILDRLPPKQ